jgi:hypothetical protein
MLGSEFSFCISLFLQLCILLTLLAALISVVERVTLAFAGSRLRRTVTESQSKQKESRLVDCNLLGWLLMRVVC